MSQGTQLYLLAGLWAHGVPSRETRETDVLTPSQRRWAQPPSDPCVQLAAVFPRDGKGFKKEGVGERQENPRPASPLCSSLMGLAWGLVLARK